MIDTLVHPSSDLMCNSCFAARLLRNQAQQMSLSPPKHPPQRLH